MKKEVTEEMLCVEECRDTHCAMKRSLFLMSSNSKEKFAMIYNAFPASSVVEVRSAQALSDEMGPAKKTGCCVIS